MALHLCTSYEHACYLYKANKLAGYAVFLKPLYRIAAQLWPKLASWFGLEVGPPLPVPLATYMPFHKGTWENIVKKHGLKQTPYERVRTCSSSCVPSQLWVCLYVAQPGGAYFVARDLLNRGPPQS